MGHQCKQAIYFISINAFQRDKRSEKVLCAPRDENKKKLNEKKNIFLIIKLKLHQRSCCQGHITIFTSPFSGCSWNGYSHGAAIWQVNKQQPASSAAQRCGLTSFSGGTSTPLLGYSLNGPSSKLGLSLLCSSSCSRLLFLLCTRQVFLLVSLLGAGGRVFPRVSACFKN